MTELRPATHTETDETMVELWEGGQMIAAIYPIDRGVRIVSKHLHDGVRGGIVAIDPSFPPALHVRVWDGPPETEPTT
jgi:hypothetical protein